MRWPVQALGGGHGQSPREGGAGYTRDGLGVGASFSDAKAQVTAEVTYEPRMLLKTTRGGRGAARGWEPRWEPHG